MTEKKRPPASQVGSSSKPLLIRAVRHAAQRTPEVRLPPSPQSIVQRRANHRWATEHSGLERCPHSRASRSTALGGIAHAHFSAHLLLRNFELSFHLRDLCVHVLQHLGLFCHGVLFRQSLVILILHFPQA